MWLSEWVRVTQLCPTLCDPMTVACQAPLSMEFSPDKNPRVGCHFPLHVTDNVFNCNFQKMGRCCSQGYVCWKQGTYTLAQGCCFLGFPGGSESTCHCRRYRFDSWVRKIPWSRKWQLTPVFLPGKFQGQRSLAGYSPQGCKESDMTEAT